MFEFYGLKLLLKPRGCNFKEMAVRFLNDVVNENLRLFVISHL